MVKAAAERAWIDERGDRARTLLLLQAGWAPISILTDQPVMPAAWLRVTAEGLFPAGRASPADQNGGTQTKTDGGAATGATWPCGWRTCPRQRPSYQALGPPGTWNDDGLPRNPPKAAMASPARQTYTAAGPHFAFHFQTALRSS